MLIKNKLLFTLSASLTLLGCGGNDSIVEGAIEPSEPTLTQETDELGEEAYKEIYDYYEQRFDELIVEFNEVALDPDIFFAEYGITSVYEEKLALMEIEGLEAEEELDNVLKNNLGNEADRRKWIHKINELYIQKVQELEEAHEVMLEY